MEISVHSLQPITLENGEETIAITDYSYTGITLLGNDIEPAMNNACAKLITFSINRNTSDVIKEMNNELKGILEQMYESSNNAVINSVDDAVNDTSISVDNTLNQVTNENIYSYENSLSKVEQTIQNLLYAKNDDTSRYFIYSLIANEQNETFVQYFDKTLKKMYAQKYTINDDIICFCGEPTELYLKNVTSDMIDEYNSLVSELSELRTFKQNILLQEENNKKSEVLNKWNEYLSENENFQKLKENHNELSIEDIEIQCKCIFADSQLLKKQNSISNNTNKNDTNIVNFNVDSKKNHSPIESNVDLFMKHFSKI